MRIKHILVPTDLGDVAERVEERAVELASKFDAKITLFHAWSIPTPSTSPWQGVHWPINEIEGAAREALSQAVARLKLKHANSEAVLTAGVAWERIVETVESRDVDLIVIGTHGRRGVSHFLLGSVAERVVRLSPVPVLTVGPESRTTAIKKILLPIDIGPASDAAIERTVDLARAFGAEVTVLHVYEAPVFVYPGAPNIPVLDISLTLEKRAGVAVDLVVGRLAGRVPAVSGRIRQGSAWRNINQVAKDVGADLIVLGTHGRRGVPRALIGSVAEKVVRTSAVPVLTVRSTDSETSTSGDVHAP